MYSARDVANYFLQLDTDASLFTKKLINVNGIDMYEGNARLNKYLHLAQNIYYAKNRQRLFKDDLYAYDNGGVVPSIVESYPMLLARKGSAATHISQDDQIFLDKLFTILYNAPVERLIELSHEDSAWEDKHYFYRKEDQVMDTDSHLAEYTDQYHDVLQMMDRM